MLHHNNNAMQSDAIAVVAVSNTHQSPDSVTAKPAKPTTGKSLHALSVTNSKFFHIKGIFFVKVNRKLH